MKSKILSFATGLAMFSPLVGISQNSFGMDEKLSSRERKELIIKNERIKKLNTDSLHTVSIHGAPSKREYIADSLVFIRNLRLQRETLRLLEVPENTNDSLLNIRLKNDKEALTLTLDTLQKHLKRSRDEYIPYRTLEKKYEGRIKEAELQLDILLSPVERSKIYRQRRIVQEPLVRK